jgi:hypothetical protein
MASSARHSIHVELPGNPKTAVEPTEFCVRRRLKDAPEQNSQAPKYHATLSDKKQGSNPSTIIGRNAGDHVQRSSLLFRTRYRPISSKQPICSPCVKKFAGRQEGSPAFIAPFFQDDSHEQRSCSQARSILSLLPGCALTPVCMHSSSHWMLWSV